LVLPGFAHGHKIYHLNQAIYKMTATTVEHLQHLTAYVPPPVLNYAFRNPHQQLAGTWRRFHGVTVFADISGFTPLAEALAYNGSHGAEELNAILNQVFEALISTIDSHGGQVVSFGGDALSVIWPCQPETMAQTAWRALQAAFAMQSTIAGFSIIPTSRGEFDLRTKIGMSAGELLEIHAGGELNRLEYVLAGEPVVNMSKAESIAVAGEIVVDKNIWQLTNAFDLDSAKQMMVSAHGQPSNLPDSYVFGEEALAGFYRISHLWSKLPPLSRTYPDWSQLDYDAAAEVAATLSNYIPAAIANVFKRGSRYALTELRPMTVCFIGFSGIDYEHDPVAGLRLHTFLRDVQQAIYRYEGSINKLDVGDEGNVLLVLFGAPPFYHDDDERRAVACALDLGHVAQRHHIQIRIGLAAGPLFLGPLGATQRREYTVIGDVVNMAARLMQQAETGQVLVDQSVQLPAKKCCAYQDLGPVSIKGRTEPRRVYLVQGDPKPEPEKSTIKQIIGNQVLKLACLLSTC